MNSTRWSHRAPRLGVAVALVGLLAWPAMRATAADRALPAAASPVAFLGVRTQELTDDLRDSYDYHGAGVLVSGVTEGSAADRVGIREGDILTKVDDLPVNNPDQLAERVQSRAPGTLVSIWVWRDGKEISLGRAELTSQDDVRGGESDRSGRRATVRRVPPPARAPEAPEPPAPPRARMRAHADDRDLPGDDNLVGPLGAFLPGRGRLGVELADLDSDLGAYFNVPGGHGVLVTRVLDDTPANRAGLKAGDVITEFDGKPVDNGNDLRRLVQAHDAGDVSLRVRRHGEARAFTARLGERMDMGFRALPRGRAWMGWLDDRGDGRNRDEIRIRGQGLSPEDRAQLRRDLEELRNDLRKMRIEIRDHVQRGDDPRDEGRGDSRNDSGDDPDDD